MKTESGITVIEKSTLWVVTIHIVVVKVVVNYSFLLIETHISVKARRKIASARAGNVIGGWIG